VWREGSVEDLTLTLRDRNGETELGKVTERKVQRLLGAEFTDVPESDKERLGIHGGAKIDELFSGKLASIGVEKGFIITEVDGKKVYDADDVANILKNKSGGVLIEGVYPNGSKAYFGFGM
ncbi:MAG: hypothetical protein HKN32_08130, partial [Flavobacteriales bacterium]|nr:hypothetical protein [Flavobacteriales bacterium]